MIYLDKEHSVMFDVDNTIVMHGEHEELVVNNPYQHGQEISLAVHEAHVNLLKDFKGRGYQVVVWSANGAAWAKQVIMALRLEEYVDVVMSKPQKYVDDLEAKDIMGIRIYMNYKPTPKVFIPAGCESMGQSDE